MPSARPHKTFFKTESISFNKLKKNYSTFVIVKYNEAIELESGSSDGGQREVIEKLMRVRRIVDEQIF